MHSEITLMYLILIPVILNHLVNLMISVLYKINHRSARKRKNNIIEPILYLKHYNQNWWRHLDYKRKKKNRKNKRYIKPKPLFNSTTNRQTWSKTTLLLSTIKQEYDLIVSLITRNIFILRQNFREGLRQISSLLAIKEKYNLRRFWTSRNFYIPRKNFWQCSGWISATASLIRSLFHDTKIFDNSHRQFTKPDKVISVLNNAMVVQILYISRIILYATVSNKLTNSKAFMNGTSKTSALFLSGIIFLALVIVMEPTQVAAATMSPQMKAYKKNMQRKRKRATESPQEKAERRASNRERTEANKESNSKRKKLRRTEDKSDNPNETRRTSDRVKKQQERDKSRKWKNFNDRIKLLMFYAARAIQATNTDITGKTNREHQSNVCLICDCFIMGAYPNGVPSMTAEEVRRHRERLSVQSYEAYYDISLRDSLKREYTVSGFEGMLLSPRSRKVARGRYAVCNDCKRCMKKKHVNKKTPPKFSIANGNAIGTFPTCIPCRSPGKQGQYRNINQDDLNPVLKAFMSPVRPFGYVFQHSGGKQKCISGHYQFFETDQNCVTGALNYIDKNIANNVFVMICGATTPRQDKSILAKTSVDIELYKDIRTWFVENSSCRAFRDEPLPSNVEELTPCILKSCQSGKDEEEEPDLENTFGGVTYAFSSAQDPLEESSVFHTSKKFACAMVKQSNPVLLLHGGNHAREHEVDLEAVIPFAFPYGMGGPNQKRPCNISKKQIIKRYTRLAMPQFMTAETILILHHIFSRQISFDTGIMTCRNKHGSRDFTRQINSLKASDFEDREDGSDPRSDYRVNSVVNSITTSCKSLGHTSEAAGAARQRQFAMMDYFGLNSLFLTITPDDECNFRVRLYADPDSTVSKIQFTNKLTPRNNHYTREDFSPTCTRLYYQIIFLFLPSIPYQIYQTKNIVKKIWNTDAIFD